jgi:hypothetical protein
VELTKRDIELLLQVFDLADAELHNRIATYPDVIEYEEDIVEIERCRVRLKRLVAKILN